MLTYENKVLAEYKEIVGGSTRNPFEYMSHSSLEQGEREKLIFYRSLSQELISSFSLTNLDKILELQNKRDRFMIANIQIQTNVDFSIFKILETLIKNGTKIIFVGNHPFISRDNACETKQIVTSESNHNPREDKYFHEPYLREYIIRRIFAFPEVKQKPISTITRPFSYDLYIKSIGCKLLPSNNGTKFIVDTLKENPIFIFPEGGSSFFKYSERDGNRIFRRGFLYAAEQIIRENPKQNVAIVTVAFSDILSILNPARLDVVGIDILSNGFEASKVDPDFYASQIVRHKILNGF